MLDIWLRHRFWIIPIVIGVGLALIVTQFMPSSQDRSSQPAPVAQPLFRGHVNCTSYEQVPPQQTNLMANLEVYDGNHSQVTFQYLCNGKHRTTNTIQVHYHVNTDRSVTFTWHSSEPRVQWLIFIPYLGHIVSTGTAIRPDQTSITIRLKPGDHVRGAMVKACAPQLPPASIGVIPGTCQVSGVRPNLRPQGLFCCRELKTYHLHGIT